MSEKARKIEKKYAKEGKKIKGRYGKWGEIREIKKTIEKNRKI